MQDGDCNFTPCPFKHKIDDTHAKACEVYRAINGENGEPGMKTHLVVIMEWVESKKRNAAAWNKALITTAVSFGAAAFIAVLILAAKGVIKLP
jgi:hypothetical protein